MSSESIYQAAHEELEPLESEPSGDDLVTIASVLYRAVQQASEWRRFAEGALGVDNELKEFFERCAFTQSERATEARQLLISRAIATRREVVTSAAFAAGDGATDADVAPSSERGSARVWPGQ
jgi:hypothetical protein